MLQPKIVYTPGYDVHFYGLERFHPFDGRKYSRAWRAIRKEYPGLDKCTVAPGGEIAEAALRAVHSPAYLQSLQSSAAIAQVLELAPLAHVPRGLIERRILRPMRLATQGTLEAARRALEGGIGINLSGGYHHASGEQGEGFSVYADVGVAVAALREAGLLVRGRDRVLLIDLDAHQGNGPERIFADDPDVTIVDLYNGEIYPGDRAARKRIDVDVPLSPGIEDAEYLRMVRWALERGLKQCPNPRIAFYNAGTDVHREDALGGMGLTSEGVFERDRLVFDTLTEAGIPWTMVLSGGYSPISYQLAARSVLYVLQNWGRSGG